MLRMESANQEIDGRPLPPLGEDARPKYRMGFGKFLHNNILYGDGHVLLNMMANLPSRFTQGLGGR